LGSAGRGDERAHVAERRQSRARVGIHFHRRFRRRRCRRHPLLERDQLLVHPIAERLAVGIDVVQLSGILLQVVELGSGRGDEFVASRRQRAQVAPAEVKARIDRLGVRREAELFRRAGHQRHDAGARQRIRRPDAEQLERGRQDVDAPDGIGDAPPDHRVVRRPNQQRHVHRRLVDEKPVRAFAMFAEALAVIAHDDNHRAIGEVMRVEVGEQASDLRIDKRDLADVRMAGIARLERFGRIVRGMRVIEVHPAEEPLRADRVEPPQRVVGNFVPRPIDAAKRERLVLAQIEVVEVGLKALRDSPLVVEHVGADEAAGREPIRLQPLGQRRLTLVEKEATVIADAVRGRERPGEDRGVCRQRQRRR
jgi:hypothetical protein